MMRLTVAKVARAFDLLGERRRQARFLFVSTDPKRDDPERLQGWLAQFNPDFIGLSGTEAELSAVEEQYGVFHVDLPPQGKNGFYLVSHTSRLYLIDWKGALRYLFTPEQSAASFAEGIRLVLAPPSWWEKMRAFFGVE